MNGGLVTVGSTGQGGNASASGGSGSVPTTLNMAAAAAATAGSSAVAAPGAPAGTTGAVDRYGLLALLNVIRMTDPDLTTLAIGSDLTTLGLNLNSQEYDDFTKAMGLECTNSSQSPSPGPSQASPKALP